MSENKAMMSIQEQIKKQVAALQESMSEKTITVARSGKFQVGPVESESDTIDVVILGFVHNAAFWEKAWTPGQSAIPDCAATGEMNMQYAERPKPPMVATFDALEPRAGADDQQPQAENCGECPNNVFGTGMGGKGKACKNTYTMAVLPAGDPKGDIHKARISASGLKFFNNYLKSLASLGLPWYAVQTTLKTEPAGSGWTIKVLSDSIKALDEKTLMAFYPRCEEATKVLTYTPPASADETEVVKG